MPRIGSPAADLQGSGRRTLPVGPKNRKMAALVNIARVSKDVIHVAQAPRAEQGRSVRSSVGSISSDRLVPIRSYQPS